MKPIILVPFDTETNGIPDWKTPSNDPAQPHIVTLAALKVDEETLEIKDRLDLIVKPDGWYWDEDCEAFKKHGITMEYAMEHGIPEADAVNQFIEFWAGCDYRIAYNTTFDNRIIRIALKRYHPELVDIWKDGPYKCTSLLAQKNLKLSKRPKLEAAYLTYTGKELEGAHNAMNDTMACLDVYRGILGKAKKEEKVPAQIMGLDDLFTFGKHLNEQLEDVIEDNPDYIEWLIKNDVVIFDEEALEFISKKAIA